MRCQFYIQHIKKLIDDSLIRDKIIIMGIKYCLDAFYDTFGQPIEENLFQDPEKEFSILIPPGWTILPRKYPVNSSTKYKQENILFVASNFIEGCSLSVTRTDARRLLKDLNIEWLFSLTASNALKLSSHEYFL